MKRVSRLLIAVLLCLYSVTGAAYAGNIVIKGSTTVLPIAQATLESYMKMNPGTKISLSGGGSGEGIKALMDASTDIATSSRSIKESELKMAKTKGIDPVATTVAIDAIVPIVHPRNPVKDLTIDQLSQIYQGKITNWKEVGGEDLQIVVISRDSSSGTFESWGELVLNKAKVTPRAQLQASNGAIVQAVSKNRYALGYIGLGYLDKSVKAVTVGSVPASVKTALSGQYPISRPLYFYTNGKPKGETVKFIRFVLSSEGQKIVAGLGFVPTLEAVKAKPKRR